MAAKDEADEPDPGSTIVRSGKAAFRFSEMTRFVRDLEERPVDRLAADLPGLLELPDAKYGLVALVIAKRMRQSPADRAAIETGLRALEAKGTPTTRKRSADLLEPPPPSPPPPRSGRP